MQNNASVKGGWAFALWVALAGLAGQVLGTESAATRPETNIVTLEVFVRSDSKHSQDAVEYVRQLEKQRTGLHVEVHDVLEDDAARATFWELAKKFKAKKPGLPAFFACDRAGFGFADAATSGRSIENLLTIRAFVREGCPHCQAAKRFLKELEQRWPAIRVELNDVIADPAAHRRMTALAKQYGQHVASLPAIEICGRFHIGYDTDATSGARLESILRKASDPLRGIQVPDHTRQGRRKQRDRQLGLDATPILQLASIQVVGIAPMLVAADEPPPLPPVVEDDTEVVGPVETAPGPQGIQVPWFGTLWVDEVGMPAFTLAIGLVDGFNPCAMWVLVFLLSVLVNVRSRAKILAIAGTFVLVSGLAYFAFMAAWLNVFLLVGFLRPLQITLGLMAIFIGLINVKDFVAFKQGISLSIPESAKEGIYDRVRKIVSAKYLGVAVAMAVVLAVGVNIVELLCTAGLPALYTQILTLQKLPGWKNYAYLVLYNVAYMFDDTLMLAAFVITLSHRKVQEREGRWLKLVSGLVVLALGVVMIFRPSWLQLAAAQPL